MLTNLASVASFPTTPDLWEDTMLTGRKLTKEIFGMDVEAKEDSKPAAIKSNLAEMTSLMEIDRSLPTALNSQQEDAQNTDMIAKFNKSIEKIQQLLLELQEMLCVAMGLVLPEPGSTGQPTAAPMETEALSATINTRSSQDAQTIVAQAQVRNPFMELTTQKPVYPKLPEPSPKCPHFYQATWCIHIPNDMDSPVQGLFDGILEIWNVLKGINDKLIIYPWRQTNHGKYKALLGPSKLPNTKEGIN